VAYDVHHGLGEAARTAEVVARVGISRQALAKAVQAGRLVSLPAGKTRLFPLWQFRLGRDPGIRPEAAEIIAAFTERLPDVALRTVASWAASPQPAGRQTRSPSKKVCRPRAG
jgi:hypothetical protein